MMCRRGAKGVPGPYFSHVVLRASCSSLPPPYASRLISSLLCALSMPGLTASCSPTFLSLLNSSSNLPPFSSDR